jgi:hypothetical protein
MGKNVKLTTTRGIIAVMLSICLIYLFVTNTADHITEYITLYMVLMNYLYGREQHDANGDNNK